MIVNYNEKGWEVITQRSHGVLAAQIGMHWKKTGRPARWLETLLAIAEHDDAEVEMEGENLLTATGGPLNFAMKKFDPEHCTRLSKMSQAKSRYIALLTSMHMVFLYAGEEKDNEKARVFLQEQRRLQAQWLKELNLDKVEAEKIYSLLEWCDAFSLLICQGQLQPESRAVEISRGPDKKKYQLYQVDENKLTVQPWPFEESSFRVHYESRQISQIQFSSSADFRRAFYMAPVQEVSWELVKAKVPKKVKKV